jgi:hypothetical protein
VVNSEG